jgi:hypothetical protein
VPRRPFRFIKRYVVTPISEAEVEAIERLLAKLIARAYLADHGYFQEPKDLVPEFPASEDTQ